MHLPNERGVQTVGVRKDDDEAAIEKLTGDHEENASDAEEIPDPEEIGEEIEVRGSRFQGSDDWSRLRTDTKVIPGQQ